MTEVPVLHFFGLPWQHTRGSALLGWFTDDAEFIAAQILAFAEARLGGEPAVPRIEGARAPSPAPITDEI